MHYFIPKTPTKESTTLDYLLNTLGISCIYENDDVNILEKLHNINATGLFQEVTEEEYNAYRQKNSKNDEPIGIDAKIN